MNLTWSPPVADRQSKPPFSNFMKILFDLFSTPFFLAHGGAQTQVLETAAGLRELGIEVEFVRWWDGKQTGDIIHTFGVPSLTYIQFAQSKGIPVVNTTLFTATCNNPKWRQSLQGTVISALLKLPSIPPWGSIKCQLCWNVFKHCDLNIVGLDSEADVLEKSYGVPRGQIRKVPLGLPRAFLYAGPGSERSNDLITTGTITERKRSLELARLAIAAKVPVLFVGKPYDSNSAYWREFKALIDGTYVKHLYHTDSVDEMIGLLQSSRGYVLYSDYENWCLSAHEAIACGTPIMVPDQRWSRELFGDEARYLKLGDHTGNTAKLREFHAQAPSIQPPDIRLHSWRDVGESLASAYDDLMTSKQPTGR
jgi:glycosyltransferase involved in cell wall biosynthesis